MTEAILKRLIFREKKSVLFPFCQSQQLRFQMYELGRESACNAGDPSLTPGSGRSAGEGIGYPLQYSWSSLVWFSWERIHLQCGKPGFNPWVRKIHWGRERLPIPVLWLREFHGLYSPWGHKELDTTERLSLFILATESNPINNIIINK